MKHAIALPLIALCSLAPLHGQNAVAPAKPFVATAQIGKPYVIGEDPDDYGKIKVDYGYKFEVTLDSVEASLSFANRRENILAKANQKLLIFRGTARNPSTETEASLTSGAMFGVRMWERFQGPGTFRFILGCDPETLDGMNARIKPGASARFIQIIEVPAAYTAMQLGLYYRSTKRIAWYDLRASAKLNSVFAGPDGGLTALQSAKVPAGSSFDFDGLEMKIAGMARSGNGYVLDLSVTNRMLLPSRWGWQYFTAELIGADGTAVPFFPDVIDKSTGKSWSGDLPAGASTTGQYTFGGANFIPHALRLTSAATGRTAEVRIGN